MTVDAHSVLKQNRIKNNSMKHKLTLPLDEEESDADKSGDSVATEGSSSTSTSSYIDSYKQNKQRLCEAWYTLPQTLGRENIKMWVPGNIKVDDLRRLIRKSIGNGGKRIVVVADNRMSGSTMVGNLDADTAENIEKLQKEYMEKRERQKEKDTPEKSTVSGPA